MARRIRRPANGVRRGGLSRGRRRYQQGGHTHQYQRSSGAISMSGSPNSMRWALRHKHGDGPFTNNSDGVDWQPYNNTVGMVGTTTGHTTQHGGTHQHGHTSGNGNVAMSGRRRTTAARRTAAHSRGYRRGGRINSKRRFAHGGYHAPTSNRMNMRRTTGGRVPITQGNITWHCPAGSKTITSDCVEATRKTSWV